MVYRRSFRQHVCAASLGFIFALTPYVALGQVEPTEQKQKTGIYGMWEGPRRESISPDELIESAIKQERERSELHIRNAKLALLGLAVLFGLAIFYRHLIRIMKAAGNSAINLAASGAASTIRAKRSFQEKINERLDH